MLRIGVREYYANCAKKLFIKNDIKVFSPYCNVPLCKKKCIYCKFKVKPLLLNLMLIVIIEILEEPVIVL